MDKIVGNYLTQANKSFPVDCETMEYIACNASLTEVIGNIAGDKVVLYGCQLGNGGTTRSAGYVFLRTIDFPEGEILRFDGGSIASGLHVVKDDIGVTANGYSFPKAYTRRRLVPGYGDEQYDWKDFVEVRSNRELWRLLSELQGTIDTLVGEPLGIVKMWAGKEVPEGYHLCDGAELSQKDYPALYSAIGGTYNNAKNSNGSDYSTGAGMFRLPDLRGRFIVGYHDSDDEYKVYGRAGGEKKHLLTSAESAMVDHNHEATCSENGEHSHKILSESGDDGGSGQHELGGGDGGVWTQPAGLHKHTVAIGQSGKWDAAVAHENRPPYYVLAYIMKLK